MRKYVQTMVAAVAAFVRERRSRCMPTQPDPLAYGHHHHVYGPAARGAAAAAVAATVSTVSTPSWLPSTDTLPKHEKPPQAPIITLSWEHEGAGSVGSCGGAVGESIDTPTNAVILPKPAAVGTVDAHFTRALWQPIIASEVQSRTAISSPFSSAEMALGSTTGYGSGGGLSNAAGSGYAMDIVEKRIGKPVDADDVAVGGGGSAEVADTWASPVCAVTSTGPCHHQELPPVSSTTAGSLVCVQSSTFVIRTCCSGQLLHLLGEKIPSKGA